MGAARSDAPYTNGALKRKRNRAQPGPERRCAKGKPRKKNHFYQNSPLYFLLKQCYNLLYYFVLKTVRQKKRLLTLSAGNTGFIRRHVKNEKSI
jgi:hypothetical protein